MRSKKALYNIISSAFLQVITVICGFIVSKLIISNYGSNINGLVSSITNFLAFITLLEAGFGPVIKSLLYKPIANNNDYELKKILKSSLNLFRKISYIFIIYVLILCVILPIFFSNDFDILYTFSLIIIISLSTFFEYYLGITYRLFLQAKQTGYVLSLIKIITLILHTIVIVILINLNANIHIVKLASSLIFILRPIVTYLYVKRKCNINLKNVKVEYNIKQKWDGLVQHIAHIIHKNTDIVVITFFCSLSEVSVYSIYYLILNSLNNFVCYPFIGGVSAAFGDMIAKGENDNLTKSFNVFECIYLTIVSIAFISTLFLIVPFVKVYTNGITDANYIRPIFAYIIVLAEFVFIIKQLYYSLVKESGDFKQTKNGAIIEALVNVLLSFILVWKLGIVGVAIGTLVAMIIRTIEIVIYTSKNILKRSINIFIKRFSLIVIEFLLILLIVNLLPQIDVSSYFDWIYKSLIVFTISSLVIILINGIIYKENVFLLINKLRNKK